MSFFVEKINVFEPRRTTLTHNNKESLTLVSQTNTVFAKYREEYTEILK